MNPSSPLSRPTAGPPHLEARDLGVHFGHRPAVTDINAAFQAGETVSLLGPNGAGKSTLLKALAGLLPPSHGTVAFAGRPVRGPDPAVVYVPQRSSVDWAFPIAVRDVALMGLLRARSRLRPYSAADRERAMAALATVGMERLAHVQIGQLSGGQQQRVFLARALVQAGEVYLLDEPFTGVDAPTQALLVELFDGLKRQGKTIVYATHDLALAAASSGRVLLLNRRLIAAGPPAQTLTAANLRAAFGGQAVLPVTAGAPA